MTHQFKGTVFLVNACSLRVKLLALDFLDLSSDVIRDSHLGLLLVVKEDDATLANRCDSL